MIPSFRQMCLCLPLLLLVACSSSNSPAVPASERPSGVTTNYNAAIFDPTTGAVPLPNVLATATAADPLTGRAANSPMTPGEALAYINLHEVGGTNAVSGLNAPIYLRFTYPVDASTVNAANIKVFQLTPDAAGTEDGALGFKDISAMFDYRYTAGSTDLFLFPNFPLSPGSRYLYVVTNRVKDADSGGGIISTVYFEALKSTTTLTGALAPLEAIRANALTEDGTHIKFSGYAKVMDDLLAPAAGSSSTTISSRADIALMGRFITTGAGFISMDIHSATTAAASRIPVEAALRYFAAGAMAKTWTNASTVDAMFDRGGTHPTPDAYWTMVLGTTTAAPASVGAVVLGKIESTELSIDPVLAASQVGVDLSAVPGAYNPAAGVLQPYYLDSTLVGFRCSATDGRDGKVPFVYMAPANIAPDGGWPLVIFQHGITRQKEDVLAVAQSLTSAGFAVVAIDLPMHGALAASGSTTGEQWGSDFMALGAPLATRTNIQQAAFNLNRLEMTVAHGGFDALKFGAYKPAVSGIRYVGHSLGSIVGAYYLASNTTLSSTGYPYTQTTLDADMKGFLSVPGSCLAYVIQNSPSFNGAPDHAVDAGLAAKGIATGSPLYHQFFLVTQTVVDPVDPATMTTPLAAGLPSRLSNRIAIQEAVGDQTIGNPYTRYFGNALGGRGVLGTAAAQTVAPGFKQLGYGGADAPRIPAPFMFTLNGTTPVPKIDFAAQSMVATDPSEGYFQFDQTGVSHALLLDPTQPANALMAQTQMLYFLGITGHVLVIDPTHVSLPSAPSVLPAVYKPIQAPKRYQILGH